MSSTSVGLLLLLTHACPMFVAQTLPACVKLAAAAAHTLPASVERAAAAVPAALAAVVAFVGEAASLQPFHLSGVLMHSMLAVACWDPVCH